MLVLTRSIGQRLILGEGEVAIQVLEIRGNQVRLGIDAPDHIAVHREEIYLKIQRAKENEDEIATETKD